MRNDRVRWLLHQPMNLLASVHASSLDTTNPSEPIALTLTRTRPLDCAQWAHTSCTNVLSTSNSLASAYTSRLSELPCNQRGAIVRPRYGQRSGQSGEFKMVAWLVAESSITKGLGQDNSITNYLPEYNLCVFAPANLQLRWFLAYRASDVVVESRPSTQPLPRFNPKHVHNRRLLDAFGSSEVSVRLSYVCHNVCPSAYLANVALRLRCALLGQAPECIYTLEKLITHLLTITGS